MSLSYGFCLGSLPRLYNSKQFSDAIASVIGDGVAQTLKQFSANINGFSVTLDTGYAFAAGRYLKNGDSYTLNLTPPGGYDDRWDAVAVLVDYPDRAARLELLIDVNPGSIKAGIMQDGDTYAIILYLLHVRRGSTSLVPDDITDTRGRDDLCGYVLPYSAVSGKIIAVYDFLSDGLDRTIDRLIGQLDKAVRTGDRALAYLDTADADITGNTLGDIVLSAVQPAPAAHWMLCDGSDVPESYTALSQLLSGTLPNLPQEDERLKAWIFGAEVRTYTGGHDDDAYLVKTPVSPEGAGTATGAGVYTQGSKATIQATANSGVEFVGWQENGAQISDVASYSFPVYCNRTITALFRVLYTISLSVSPPNSGTASGGGTYPQGESITVKATPKRGYVFSEWDENGTSVSKNANYTFTVDKNRSLVAAFAVKPSRLPAGYTELQYIVTDTYCEINSGVEVINGKAIIQTDIMYLGGEDTSAHETYSIFTTEYAISHPGYSVFFLVYAPKYGTFYVLHANSIDRKLNVGERVSIELNSKLNYVRIGATSYSKNFNTHSTNFGNVIFGRKNDCLHMRIYSIKIYSDDTLTGDFVPCESPSGLFGLYNLVDNTFHGATNGTITGGPDA